MKVLKLPLFLLVFMFLLPANIFAQNSSSSMIDLPRDKIYAFGMDGDVKSILSLIDVDLNTLSEADKRLKIEYESRFKGLSDESNYVSERESDIDDLLVIFRDYWGISLLNPDQNYDRTLGEEIVPFLMKNYPPIRGVKVERDSIGTYLSRYIRSKGLYTIDDIDYQGRLIDLMVWRSQQDTIYELFMDGAKTKVMVSLLNNFVSLGWMEYATLGAHHPGGWSGTDGLYCVEKSYDLDSEDFRVSFLAHESRHFFDQKQFPNLKNAKLEYRAKLVELSLAKTTIYSLIEFFIDNSNPESENAHSVANYRVIEELSRSIFQGSFEKNIQKWESVSSRKINKAADRILKFSTEALNTNMAEGQ